MGGQPMLPNANTNTPNPYAFRNNRGPGSKDSRSGSNSRRDFAPPP